MDDETLQSLEAAFTASPDNTALLTVLISTRLERGEVDRAVQYLASTTVDLNSEALRHIVAEVYLNDGRPEEILALIEEGTDEDLIWRVRALKALDRTDEARPLYQRIVAANPTLEDPELELLLRVPVDSQPDPAQPTKGKLRVISNDDTDLTEVERLLAPTLTPITFADVGGLDEVKKQIHKRIILPFQKPSLFLKFRKRVGGGVLLYGPPGCGKTMLARATAGECHAQFLSVSISDILDMYIGESERKLHAIFEKARSRTPAVLFFDELEGLAAKRQYSRDGVASKLVSQFLSEMDGFTHNNQGVLILGATNVPWAVDPAFRRPGRFDRLMFIPPPDRKARQTILSLLLEDRPHEGIDINALAKKTPGFSGADLENLVENAADEAIEASVEQGREVPIATAHLKSAVSETKATTTEWLTTARNYARYANEGGQYDEVLAFIQRHGK